MNRHKNNRKLYYLPNDDHPFETKQQQQREKKIYLLNDESQTNNIKKIEVKQTGRNAKPIDWHMFIFVIKT